MSYPQAFVINAVKRSRLALVTLGLVALTGCAGAPQFTELDAQVEPPAGLEPSDDAELRVRLSDDSGTLAETQATPHDSGPWPVTLRFDRRTFESARSPQLSAELRQQGNLTHITPEPVIVPGPDAGPFSLPLAPRP
ncbi:YbaY family lipoprotein [Billgrantia kenyensis]|jgi:hypothetical protein|uniref:YbaY family lipoprotein n=1 Tax=Billgrantia kenyensis TaxID=321266 RepID=A0A7W0AFI1_9GAMM|nr:YbaY family lipoprotein [Halomonas kenyensis]MBA2780639.1 YbaY family lipoprotein [Halomonas kenyensis]MCG6663476.1 hypothetical protein [Halomonas kenyensis]